MDNHESIVAMYKSELDVARAYDKLKNNDDFKLFIDYLIDSAYKRHYNTLISSLVSNDTKLDIINKLQAIAHLNSTIMSIKSIEDAENDLLIVEDEYRKKR